MEKSLTKMMKMMVYILCCTVIVSLGCASITVYAVGPNLIGKGVDFSSNETWTYTNGTLANLVGNSEGYIAANVSLKPDAKTNFKTKITVMEKGTVGYAGPRILYRYTSDNEYMVLGFFADGSMHLIRRDNKGLKILESVPFMFEINKSFMVDVSSTVSSVTVKVDGVEVMKSSNPEILNCKPGIGVYAALVKLKAEKLEFYDLEGKIGEYPQTDSPTAAPTNTQTPTGANQGSQNVGGKVVDPIKGKEIKLDTSGDGRLLNGIYTFNKQKEESKTTFNLAGGEKLSDNYAFKGKFKYNDIGGEGYHGIRIIFRYSSDNSYYAVMFNKAGEVQILKLANNQWLSLNEQVTNLTNFPFIKGKEYAFEIYTEPSKVSVRIDGKEIMSGEITSGVNAGVGIHVVNCDVKLSNLAVVIPENAQIGVINKDPVIPKNTLSKIPAKEFNMQINPYILPFFLLGLGIVVIIIAFVLFIGLRKKNSK